MKVRALILCGAALGLALATSALASPGASGHAHEGEAAYGVPGDPSKPARTVNITMRESEGKMLFVPDRIEVKKGEQIKFVIRNNGEVPVVQPAVKVTVTDALGYTSVDRLVRARIVLPPGRQQAFDLNIELPERLVADANIRLAC